MARKGNFSGDGRGGELIGGYGSLSQKPVSAQQPETAETKSVYTPTVLIKMPNECDLFHVTALWYLPSVWKTVGVERFVTVPSGVVSADGDPRRYEDSCDLEIVFDASDDSHPQTEPYELRGNQIVFTRFGKFAQADYIKRKLRAVGQQDLRFTYLNCWKHWKDIPSYAGSVMVVKSENGARGISHLFFSTELTTPSRVGQCLTELRNGGQTLAHPDSEPQDRSAFMLSVLNANLPEGKGPAAIFPQKGDSRLNEGYHQLLSGPTVWQEVRQDIVAEFRVITDQRGFPSYFLRRDRNLDDESLTLYDGKKNVRIGMARGNTAKVNSWMVISKETDRVANDPPSWIRQYLCMDFANDAYGLVESTRDTALTEAILKGINALNLPLHALDIYLTADHRWGIFEFCPQFGTASVPNTFLHSIGKAFIEETAEKVLKP